MDELVTSVDLSLRILDEPQVRKHIVFRFSVIGYGLSDKIRSCHVDRWIKLVAKHYVQKLTIINLTYSIIEGKRYPSYEFPPAAFDVGSLVKLSLEGCTLKKDYLFPDEDTSLFCCLKKLKFNNVDIDDDELVIMDLLSRCPSLEYLVLINCEKFDSLEIINFPKLKKVKFYPCDEETSKFKIESENLRVIWYVNMVKPLDLEAVGCSNLNELHLVQISITNNYIEEIFLRFPCLEVLKLRDIKSFESADDEIKISSNQLKTLELMGEVHKKRMVIDAPNLRFYCQSVEEEFPLTLAVNSDMLEQLDLVAEDYITLDTMWFLRLQNYIGQFPPALNTKLRVRICGPEHDGAIKNSSEEPPSARAQVMELVMEDIRESTDYTALVDDLLWSCTPNAIRMQPGPFGNIYDSTNFVKRLYKMFIEREEKPLCCRDFHTKCWRHYLKSAELINFSSTKDGETIYHEGSSAVSLLDSEGVTNALIRLQW